MNRGGATPEPGWEDDGAPTQMLGSASIPQNLQFSSSTPAAPTSPAPSPPASPGSAPPQWTDSSGGLEDESDEDDYEGMTQVVMPNVAFPESAPSAQGQAGFQGTGFPEPEAAPTEVAQPLRSAPSTLFGPAAVQIQQERTALEPGEATAPALQVPMPVAPPASPAPPPLPAAPEPAGEALDSTTVEGDPEALGADVHHHGPWKLQTNFGLTYEFPDTEGLRSWLMNREDLDTYALSADDGESFFPLSDFPQLSERRPTPTAVKAMEPTDFQTGEGLAGVPRFATSAVGLPKITAQSYQPPSQNDDLNKWLVAILMFLLVIATPLLLNVTGFDRELLGMDLKEALLGDDSKTSATTSSAAPGVTDTKPSAAAFVPSAETQQDDIERTLRDAKRLVRRKRLQSAIKKLEIVLQLEPNNEEARTLAIDVYNQLGLPEKAKALSTPPSEEGPDAGADAAAGDGAG